MRVFDCTTFFEEHLMMELRFNVLNEYVEKFIVVESKFSHSGQEKKLNFDIDNFKKFKHKIIYLVIENEPNDLIKLKNDDTDSAIKRLNEVEDVSLVAVLLASDAGAGIKIVKTLFSFATSSWVRNIFDFFIRLI